MTCSEQGGRGARAQDGCRLARREASGNDASSPGRGGSGWSGAAGHADALSASDGLAQGLPRLPMVQAPPAAPEAREQPAHKAPSPSDRRCGRELATRGSRCSSSSNSCSPKATAVSTFIAVGMPVTRHPLHRSGREALPHPAPTLGMTASLHWTTESSPTAGWPYRRQRLGHARPALRPVRVTWPPVPLGHRPSLHPLRCPSWRIVRGLLRYYGDV